MPVSIDKARDFVYANGVLWEQALFSYLLKAARLSDCISACFVTKMWTAGGDMVWNMILNVRIRIRSRWSFC